MPTQSAPRIIQTIKITRRRKLLFATVAVVVGLLLLEGLASMTFSGIELFNCWQHQPRVVDSRPEHHCQYDAELGWAGKPNVTIHNYYGEGSDFITNNLGMRGVTNYPHDHSKIRVVCVGDSFTVGYGVNGDDSFPSLLQASNKQIEVANLGQEGYSIGQNSLWLRRVTGEVDPDVVVCVWIVEDFRRLTRRTTSNGYGTPQFHVEDGQVVVSNTPVPQKLNAGASMPVDRAYFQAITKHSSLARGISILVPKAEVNPDDSALFIGLHIIMELREFLRSRDCELICVLSPTASDLFGTDDAIIYQSISVALSEHMSRIDIPYLDLKPAFQKHVDATRLFLPEEFHHYNESGNALVADTLNHELPRLSIRVFQASQTPSPGLP